MNSLNFLLSETLLRAIILPVLLLSNIYSYSIEGTNTLPWQQPEGPCVLPWPKNIPIPVFDTPVSNNPVNYIIQDAIENNLFIGIVIDDSPLRFKIKYYIPIFTDGWYSEGWVDKSNLAICPVASCSQNDNVQCYILYNTPLKEKFHVVELPDKLRIIQPLEFFKQESPDNHDTPGYLLMVKVVIETNSGILTGWIDRYTLQPPAEE